MVRKGELLSGLRHDEAVERSSQLNRQGAYAESAELCRRALAAAPDSAELMNNLGVALVHLGRWQEAAQAFEGALERRPGFAPALSNLAATYIKLRRLSEAGSLLGQVLKQDPTSPEPLLNMATLLRMSGRLSEAGALLERACRVRPEWPELWEAMAVWQRDQGEPAQAVACFERVVQLAPGAWRAGSGLLLCLNYLADLDPLEVYARHRAWARRFADPLTPAAPAHENDPDPERPLHVGYLSPDFRRHPVAAFLAPVLEAHDRERFRITCYASVARPDEVTRELKAQGHQWRDVVSLADAELAELIRKDRVDILVELAGHTQDHRLLAVARRPAPVQVTWLGYPNTTGMRAVDYRITDALADPPGQTDHLHSERLWRLPEGFSCWRPPRDAPEAGPSPAGERGGVTLASFNYAAKLTPQVLELWARIMRQLPESRLLLKYTGLEDPDMQRKIASRLAALGVSADRLELRGSVPGERAHYEFYRRVDVALDPFPYNGTTTTCEALWMGVPVVTLAGRTHAGRVGVSLLTQVGLTELIASSAEDYVRVAVELARDQDRLARLRAGLRERMMQSPLTDAAGFTRRLEEAYREMWRRWAKQRRRAEGASSRG